MFYAISVEKSRRVTRTLWDRPSKTVSVFSIHGDGKIEIKGGRTGYVVNGSQMTGEISVGVLLK